MAFRAQLGCLCCGSSESETLLSERFDRPPLSGFLEEFYGGRIPQDLLIGVEYTLARCPNCDFVWQVNRLDPEHAELLYSEWISKGGSLAKKREADIGLYSGYCRQIELIPRLLARPSHSIRVLDFGMGWGRWVEMARALGLEAHGLESSPERVEHARKRGLSVFSDFTELAGLSFDFINAEQVFEHVDDPKGVLVQLVRHLRPEGWIRISVPNARPCLRALARGRWRPAQDALAPLEHINCFTNRPLRLLAESSALVVGRQPFLPGQGLLGKSFRRGAVALAKSVAGVPYRRFLGTTIWFKLPG